MQALVKVVKIKSAELKDGFKVELLSEGDGAAYRVNVEFDGIPRTRVFTNYAEASALFESYMQGN